MGFFTRRFPTIAFCLTLIIVQSFEELIVLRHPPTDNSSKRKLTCITDDDDAALIWNYSPRSIALDSGRNNFTDLQTGNSASKNDANCAIWNSTKCFVRWNNPRGWDRLNSSLKPMGPVFDYRWEGFGEFVFGKSKNEKEFQYVGRVADASDTIVFSARASQNIDVFLCQNEYPTTGPCYWVKLGGWINSRSAIAYCSNGVPSRVLHAQCNNIFDIEHGVGDVLDEYEWRTFTLKWTNNGETIQIFKETDSENMPFLNGSYAKRNSGFHILIRSDLEAYFRFHFYEYWLSTKEGNSVLQTESFHQQDKNFCVELLVGLCPECKLSFSLVSADGTNINIGSIVGMKNDTHNGLLSWRSEKLHKTLENFRPENIRLQIQTIFNGVRGEGRWAFDNIRMCKLDNLRKTTITIARETTISALWPRVQCQKLSPRKNSLVDTSSRAIINHDIREIKQLIAKWQTSCTSSCMGSSKYWSICDSTGCDCNQGFWGNDCQEECKYCKNDSCHTATGHCSAGCKDDKLQSPACKIAKPVPVAADIQSLRTVPVNDTEVEIQWKPFLSDNGRTTRYEISIKLEELFGCANLGRQTPMQENILIPMITKHGSVSIKGLRPYANYTATVIAHTTIPGSRSTIAFQTPASTIPTSKVSGLTIDAKNTLKWDAPTDCTTITGPTKYVKLIFYVRSGLKWNKTGTNQTGTGQFDLCTLQLPHYASCKVRVHITRALGGPKNSSSYEERTWQTPPAAPPALQKLEIYEPDPDTNSISLRWLPPQPANGEIELYQVSIFEDKKLFQNRRVTVSEAARNHDEKTNCVGIRRFVLPPDTIAHNTSIQVSAKNKNVTQFGIPSTVRLELDLHFKVPSRPLNLTAIPAAHGIVNLEWEHPAFLYKKIVRFQIIVALQETKLLKNIAEKLPQTIEHPVSRTKVKYNRRLDLLTSTSYIISVKAVNVINMSSSPAEVNVSVKEEVAFASGGFPQISQNGTTINLEIPKVVNATRETMVSVIMKGSVTCSDHKQPGAPVTLTKLKQNWIAAEYRPEENRSKMLTIDVKSFPDATSECFLNFGEKYNIEVVLNGSQTGVSAKPMALSITLSDHKPQNLVWLIICPIMAICLLLILFICYRKRKVIGPELVIYAEIIPIALRGKNKENLTGSHNRRILTPSVDNIRGQRDSSPLYAVPFVSKSNSVSITCFEEYVKKSTLSGDLTSQYAMFPRGITKSCEYGRLPQNMPKNRNKILIAYDDTRVILDKIPDDPYSDYINANYIQGYGEETAYIATQGPKPNTVNDFWRMIWQKKVLVICMLTSVIENGKKVCEKYWPEVGTKKEYGKITVFNTDHEVFADYTFRTFQLSLKQETRKVKHLHYTAWPEHGVPMHSQFLVLYLQKLAEALDGRGPVVIHCSEGNGRTGTMILCDMCVRQGIVEREIDVQAVAQRMYGSRANMLDSPQQYLFAHIIIAESIMSIPTQVPCDDNLPNRIKTLKKQLPSHIQRLNNALWQQRALHSIAQPQSQISIRTANNELPEPIAVSPEAQIHYQRNSDFNCKSNYIKAVSVDGAIVKKQYLASQFPSTSDLPNFWRFIAERKIELVLILQRPDPNDPMFCDIMPGESILVPVPYIQIETKASFNENEFYTIDELLLMDTSEAKVRSQSVTVLTCSGWGCGEREKPPAVDALVSLWRTSEKMLKKEIPALVLCQDGVTGCGLYLALSFLLERMTVAKECDVISAVRAVRRSRPEFVQSLDQFQYLYESAVNYAECFQIYANLA